MGILNYLWTKVWHDEARTKQLAFETEVRDFVKQAELRRDAYTEKQKAALKHGGALLTPESDLSARHYFTNSVAGISSAVAINNANAVQNKASSLHQQAAMQTAQSHQQQALIHSGLSGMVINPATPSIPYPNAVTGHNNTAVGYGALASGAWSSMWDNILAATFYMALRGIEQASMQKPKGNFAYDDMALGIQDYRNFNGDEIDLLGLTSFCLSNLMEVEPVVLLLEGYGMKVV